MNPKAALFSELLLLVGLLAVAYLLYMQQDQLVGLELELDRMRGHLGADLPPVPAASENGPEPGGGDAQPRRRRKAADA